MNKTIRLIVSIMAGVLAGLVFFGVHEYRVTCIRRVFIEQRHAVEPLQRARTVRQMAEELRKLDDALDAIDTNGCPDDFRLAWLEYVQCVHDFNVGRAVGAGLEVVLAIPTHSAKLAEDAAEMVKDNPRAHMEQLERIAVKYGAL